MIYNDRSTVRLSSELSLTIWFVEHNARPVAGGKVCLAYVGYLARTQSAHPHTLANYKLLRVGCQHGAVVI